MVWTASSGGAGLRRLAVVIGECSGRSQGRLRPRRRPRMLQALVGQDQVLPVAQEAGPLPDRAGQRLRRQHLAHPDGQDRQGVRREPEIKADIKEFKVVSTGTDVAAQLGAIENFIN